MNPNPYESPSEASHIEDKGPFRNGIAFGRGLIVAVLFLLGSLIGLILSIIKALFSKTVVTMVGTYAVLALIAWPLWNFAAPAAFPYLNELTYLQTLALLVVTTILFKTASRSPQEEQLSEQERIILSALRSAERRQSGACPPGTACDTTPRRNAYRPQQPVPQPPAGKV